MFRCQLCDSVSKPRVAVKSVILDKRPRSYENRKRVTDPENPEKYTIVNIFSEGWEIVKEVFACAACAEKYAEKV